MHSLLNSIIKPVYADNLAVPIGTAVQGTGFFGYTCIKQLIFNLATAGLTIGGLVTLIYLVWGGVEWITSSGDKQKTESAKNRITGSLTGLAIVATSWALYQVILYFFGIDISTICNEPTF